jgi:hypothetical protein
MQAWSPQPQWSAAAGTLTTNGSGERHLLTAVPFGDLDLQFEYKEASPIGAKLRLWTDRGDNGGLAIDLDSSGSPAGVGGIEALAHSSIETLSEGWRKVEVEANGGQVRVLVDGKQVAHASGLGSRAGYLGFEANGTGELQVRNITVEPLGLNKLFNGTDLNGWRSIAHAPDSKGGMGHAFEKAFSLGAAGGTTKGHDAKWNVQGGSIRGESGPGGLENSAGLENGIVQLTARVKGEIKPDNFTALVLRGTAGQLGSGYQVGIGPYAGGIEPVARRAPTNTSGFVDETIVIAGRTIAVWVGPTLAQVHTDTRAENANPARGAKVTAGTLSFMLPNGKPQIEAKSVAMALLPKSYGAPAKAPAPPPPPPPAAAAPAPQPSVAETAMLQQQQDAARKSAEDQQNKEKAASLMSRALSATDPQQQMLYYGQVVQIDPTNAAAVQGFKDAQARLEATQSAQQQAQTREQQQQQDTSSREEQTNSALVQAQSSFLAGDLSAASSSLSVAERLSPANPVVRDLRSRINSARSLRNRLYLLGGGAGLLGLIAAAGLWLRRRRQHRYAVLEIARGLNTGRTFPLDKDVVRIGAVQQDGGQKNDFIVQDVEHQVSRFHCEVARKDGQFFITDLRSSNGTRVNGQPLTAGSPAPLRKGSRITLGDTVELVLSYRRRSGRDA